MTPFEELRPILNPVQQADLATVLELTKAERRVAVLLAFTALTQEEWATAAELQGGSVSRWINGVMRLPFGGALRLAHVVGVDPELLFKHYLDRRFEVAAPAVKPRRMRLAG